MIKLWKKFVRGEEAATMVEYGLMVALVAVICVGAVTIMGQGVQATFNLITASL